MNSILYAVNPTAQDFVATGTVVNFGNVVRRYGNAISLNGGNVEINNCGYYSGDANFNFSATSAGTVTVQLYNNGVAIPGATATISATASEQYAITIPFVIRQNCNCTRTLTAIISGEPGSLTNATILVDKA